MASRGVDARHRPLVRSRPFLGLLGSGAERGHSTAAAASDRGWRLTLAEREEISRGLGRRPIDSRHGRGARARALDDQSRDRAQWRTQAVSGGESRQARLAIGAASKALQVGAARLVAASCCGKARAEWSPQQIAGWLKRENPRNEARQVSHETIYRSLYVQARGVLKKQLIEHLRSQRADPPLAPRDA